MELTINYNDKVDAIMRWRCWWWQYRCVEGTYSTYYGGIFFTPPHSMPSNAILHIEIVTVLRTETPRQWHTTYSASRVNSLLVPDRDLLLCLMGGKGNMHCEGLMRFFPILPHFLPCTWTSPHMTEHMLRAASFADTCQNLFESALHNHTAISTPIALFTTILPQCQR